MVSTGSDEDPLFYIGDQHKPWQPPREGIDAKSTEEWREIQCKLKRGPRPVSICYLWYQNGDDLAPDCPLTLREVAQIIVKFDKLSLVEKRQVPIIVTSE